MSDDNCASAENRPSPGILARVLSLIQSIRFKISCQNSSSECTDRKKGAGYFEDEPVTCPPGSVPDTYTFKCPGDMCSTENSKPAESKIRPMPKTDCSKCESSKTPDNCVEEMDKGKKDDPAACKKSEEKQNFEDIIPPITTKLPDTISFKCPGPGCCAGPNCEDKGAPECEKSEEKNADTCNNNSTKKCGCGPVPGKPCKCPKTPPPRPSKPPSCDCKGGICGPNTSCEVTPLTMKRK